MHETRTIHHVEDEPEEILWLCGALENRYGLEHPEWLVADSFDDSVEGIMSFRLSIKGREITIRHCVYVSAEEFRERFTVLATEGDLAIIDLMLGGDEDDNEFAGLELYKEAAGRLGEKNVYALTAYNQQVADSIDATRVIEKPPDMTTFITRIVSLLALGEGQ